MKKRNLCRVRRHQVWPSIFAIISWISIGAVPEKLLNQQFDLVYCSAMLIQIDSGNSVDADKALKLLRKADRINSSLPAGYKQDVNEDRKIQIQRMQQKNWTKDMLIAFYEGFGCDLKY